MLTPAHVEAAIAAIAPDLAGREVRPAGRGECNEAWWVGNEHVFRFAVDAGVGAALELEMAVLPQLAQALDVQIPLPEFLGTDPATGFVVLGHRAVHGGRPLTRSRLEALAPPIRSRLAADLGRLLDQLGHFPWRELDVELPETTLQRNHLDRASTEALAFPRMKPSDVQVCLEAAAAFQPCLEQDWVLLHADLYAEEHILLDADDRLAGIIDFGDLCVGDPACELSALIDDLGLDFRREIVERSGVENPADRLRRGHFFSMWNGLAWAAEQVGLGRPELADEDRPRLEELLGRW